MVKKIYYWFRNKTSKPDERGEPSAGHWQNKVREVAFTFCVSEKGSLLEVGCGEGLFIKKLIENNCQLQSSGIDISLSQLSKAKKRIYSEDHETTGLFQADATSLPFRDDVFDVILCINVFMNMPQDDMVDSSLREIKRVARKGAKVICDIRNSLNPLINIKYNLAQYYDATIDSSRLKRFNLYKFEKRLKMFGFYIQKKTTIGFPRGSFAPIVIIEALSK